MYEEPSSDGGSQITGYRLTLKSGGKEHYLKMCETPKDQLTNSCFISMDTLAKFGLEVGDSISDKISVQASNSIGWSDPSAFKNQYPTINLMQKPIAIRTLKIKEYTINSVTISWPASQHTYTVYQSISEAMPFAELTKTTKSQFRISDLSQASLYRFRVDISNACGTSQSNILTVMTPSAPDKIPPVKTISEDCMVRFSWEKPNDGGSAIQTYKLEVKNHRGQLFTLKKTSQTEFMVNMSMLEA